MMAMAHGEQAAIRARPAAPARRISGRCPT
jgi:hypothetical protein